jgi:hypothetical protein
VIVERPQVLTPLPEPWFAEYQEWRLRWDAPILAQYPPITILDQDLEEIKSKREEVERSIKVGFYRFCFSILAGSCQNKGKRDRGRKTRKRST